MSLSLLELNPELRNKTAVLVPTPLILNFYRKTITFYHNKANNELPITLRCLVHIYFYVNYL